MFLGRREEEIVGAILCLIQGKVAYAHLSAFNRSGYELGASYGIRWMAMRFLREQGIQYLDLGGAAGIAENPRDGLAQFKKAWSNDVRMVHFCSRVFDRQRYEFICQQKHIANVDHFPAYRAGEFCARRKAETGGLES